MSLRAGIVVTGTEVLTGRVQDRNGPWLSDQLRELGIDHAHTSICGDRPEDMGAQLSFMRDQGVDVILTSGGLGPTADDLTLEIVSRFSDRPLTLDEDLEARIAAIIEPLLKRWPNVDLEAVRAANRKQALVPEGATILEPVGTAPGMVVPPRDGVPTVVVLPGPPRELQGMWPAALAAPAFVELLGRATQYRQTMLRLFGIPESEIAETLRIAEAEIEAFDALEITTCLRRGEVEVVTRFEPRDQGSWEALAGLIETRHADTLFSRDGSSVDEQVVRLLDGRRIAVAESCTGGLLAARLTARPGSSAHVSGGVVAYANEAKSALLDVHPDLIERHGAVSAEVAEAMSDGAMSRFGADVAISTTGIAGPGGGSDEKPVGTVFWCAKLADGTKLARTARLPGDRAEIRDRGTTVAMHLLRRLLVGEGERGD